MPISFALGQGPVSAAVTFQGAFYQTQWFQKLDSTLQNLYQKRKVNKTPSFQHDLPVAIYFKSGKLTPQLRQIIREMSLAGRAPQNRAAAEREFEHTNVPGAPEADRMIVARFFNIHPLKSAAKLHAVERIHDSSYWAASE